MRRVARIVLTTFGSSGDINPFIAMALELRTRGHEVVFAIERFFQPLVESLGFAVRPLTGSAETALLGHERRLYGKLTPISSVRAIVNHAILPPLRAKVEELRDICAESDVLVSAAVQLAASFAADLTGIPWASVVLTPVTLPSVHTEPQPLLAPVPPALQLWANRVSWAFGKAAMRQVFDAPVNRVRAEFGLPPRRDLAFTGNLSRTLTALAVSPAFAPPQPDWPPYVRETGFCYWDRPTGWEPSPELTAFLSAPGPVVAASSGSMGPVVREGFRAFFATSIASIRRAGARALVIGAAEGTLPDPLSEGVLALDFAPFSWLYPRVAAVIHHGGIGTTAQALRAGTPALVVPWGADQYYAGAQVQRVGTGRWLQRQFYTVERGARALQALLTDPGYRARAQAIAARIARENGPATFADALEGMLARENESARA